LRETERSTSFCGHTVAAGEILVIPDALRDLRFQDNPFVLGEPHVRFYAGCPLAYGRDDLMVGTLCLVDTRPRLFGEDDRRALRELADVVCEEFKNRNRELAMAHEERLRILLAYSDSGFFDDYFEKGSCYFSPRWKEILGYEDGELINHYRTFRGLVHPDDLERVLADLAPVGPGIHAFCSEFRMRHKDERWVWIESRGVIAADERGRTTRHLGFIVDVSERHESRERLRLLELCFERITQGVLITDAQFAPAQLSILDVNPAFEQLTGYTRDEVVGTSPFFLSGPYTHTFALINRLFEEQRPLAFSENCRRKDGSVFRSAWVISPLHDAEGRLTHLITSLQDLEAMGREGAESIEAGLEPVLVRSLPWDR